MNIGRNESWIKSTMASRKVTLEDGREDGANKPANKDEGLEDARKAFNSLSPLL